MSTALFESDGVSVVALRDLPDVVEFSGELLAAADPRWLERRDNIIDIHVSNGRWVYEIVEECEAVNVVVARIRYRERY